MSAQHATPGRTWARPSALSLVATLCAVAFLLSAAATFAAVNAAFAPAF